jgi:DUF4097 and DUF4098 domain-containing protein YvlB
MMKMKYVAAAATAIWCLAGTSVIAGEKVDKTLDVATDGEIAVYNNRGEISIVGWDKPQVSVKGELDDLTEKFIFKTHNNKTYIKVVLPDRNTNSRSGRGSNLKIYIPKSSALQFDGVATDIRIEKLDNSVDIGSVSGDITLSELASKAYINSVSGDIQANGVGGRLEISTVSGDVDAKVSSKKISVSGVSSEIKITTQQINSVQISTVSGDASLHGALEGDGSIKFSNVSGNSFYYANQNLNARVVLDTGPGGEIINRFSDHKATSSFIGSEKLKFTAGDGNGLIRMSTVSGEIGLKAEK